jgi:hypothetical protein
MMQDWVFQGRIHVSLLRLREAGLNETIIASIVTDIRSASISAEFYRIQRLMELNPPHHMAHGAMREALKPE